MEFDSQGSRDLIRGERIWTHHRKLCTEIGQRLLGTDNDRRASEYIESNFKQWGYKTESQYFDCPTWDHFSTKIKNEKGFEITPPEGGACMFSLPCNVTGDIVNVRTLGELEGADLAGKICVISGELRYAPVRADRNSILLLLESKSPLAVIIIDTIKNGYMTKIIRDPQLNIPICAVTANGGERILKDGGRVTIEINSKRHMGWSRNVFATNGEENAKKVRITAHYDTSDTPGAVDNGSGTSILLEVAEAFKKSEANIPIEFIAFGGEEYAGMGASEYERVFPHRIENTFYSINIDAVGGCGFESRIYLGKENDMLNGVVKRQAQAVGNYHNLIVDNMRMVSDHKVFCAKNIPVVFVNDVSDTSVCDTTLDIPRIVCLERLSDAAKIVLGTILEMEKYL